MDLKDTYDRIAEEWSRDHKADTWWQEGTDVFASYLKPGATVLDVGCGDGTKAAHLLGKGLRVMGVDFSEKLLAIARREVPGGEFQILDLYDLPRLKRTFDGVYCSAVLLHVPKAKVAHVFRDLAAKTKPGGYLYVAVKEIWPGQAEEGFVTASDYGYAYGRFFSFFTPEEVRRHFAESGFTVRWEKVAEVGKTRWIQVVGERESVF